MNLKEEEEDADSRQFSSFSSSPSDDDVLDDLEDVPLWLKVGRALELASISVFVDDDELLLVDDLFSDLSEEDEFAVFVDLNKGTLTVSH